MGSESKRKKAEELFRGLFNRGDKGSMSDDARRDASTSSLPANDPPAVVIHTPSCSTLPTISARDSNNLSLNQVNSSLMTTPGGILNNASNFALHNPSLVDQSTINHYHQQPMDPARAMAKLLKHILPGAAHDSSARDPPPRCHPDTRIAINERIVKWFYDAEKKEWLLWINGLAGVGKSAIIQTLAEKLALAKHLGASVFISRPRQCNDSQRIFLTIAYQLAQRIDAYYAFVTEKLARDPGLVNKGMKEQFQVFIVEPFVEKKIGADGHSLAILVDGLDELDTRRGQQEIIRLITSFVLEHPHIPLTWVIASRPEPHISATFGQEKIASSYTTEEVPIDSNEACQDVERYLNSSFETIRNDFPRIVPGEDWPSQRDVWRLTHAASGLFAFAEFAIRFIGDMDYADPVARLEDVLVAIDHAMAGAFDDWPFASLDTLYTRILESISPKMWPTTKRVFSVLVLLQGATASQFRIYTLCDLSLVLGIELGTIYASFNNCSSVLKIPPRGGASRNLVTFYHASFGDYLLDSTRSGCFHISSQDAKAEVYSSFIRIWQRFQAQFPLGLDSEYEYRRYKFCEEYSYELTRNPGINPLSQISEVFAFILVEERTMQEGYSESDEDRNRCFDLLKQLDSSTVCQRLSKNRTKLFVDWVFDLWTEFGEELASRGIICEVPFEQLRLDHLDWPTLYPSYTYVKDDVSARDPEVEGMYLRVRTRPALTFESTESDLQETCSREEDISGIKEFQQRCPQLPVLICGCPGKRFALLKDPKPQHGIQCKMDFEEIIRYDDALRYYIIPYPDPQNTQQLLRAKFATIRETFPQIVPINWPTEADFRKLADAASGQYAFATMAIRFIEDHTHANPISRLEEILSIVDGQSDEMSRLDTLYTHVLCSIPSTEWPTMKRVLGALLCIEKGSSGVHGIDFQDICKILGLDEDTVYVLYDNYSFSIVLVEHDHIDHQTVIPYHTSFVDYMMDPTRSNDFHISVENAREDVLLSMFRENGTEHNRLCLGSGTSHATEFTKYMHDVLLDSLINNHDLGQPGGPFVSQKDRDRCFELLGQLNAEVVCAYSFKALHFQRLFAWVFDIWEMFQEELSERRIIRQVKFAQLRFDYLDQNASLMCCACTRLPGQVKHKKLDSERVAGLDSYQQRCPHLPVLICGNPGNRFALFEYHAESSGVGESSTSRLYIIPYPDETPPEIY